MVTIIAQALLVTGTTRSNPKPPTTPINRPLKKLGARQTRSSTNILLETPNRALTPTLGSIPLPQQSTIPGSTNVIVLHELKFRDSPEKIHILVETALPGGTAYKGQTLKDNFKVAYEKTLEPSGIDMSEKSNFLGVYFFDSQGQASMCYGMDHEISAHVVQTWLGTTANVSTLDIPKIVLVVDKVRGASPAARFIDDPDVKLGSGTKPAMFEVLVKVEKLEIAGKVRDTSLKQKDEETDAKDKHVDRLNEEIAGCEDHIVALRGKATHARDTYLQPEVRGLQAALKEAQKQYVHEQKGKNELAEACKREMTLYAKKLTGSEYERLVAELAELKKVIDGLRQENDELRNELETAQEAYTNVEEAAKVAMEEAFY